MLPIHRRISSLSRLCLALSLFALTGPHPGQAHALAPAQAPTAVTLVGSLQAQLLPPDPAVESRFGQALAMSGDRLVVVGRQVRLGNVPLDLGYVHERLHGTPDGWGLVKKLTGGNALAVSAPFDYSVAVSGDTIVVGAENDSTGGPLGHGTAYVLDRNQGGPVNWGVVKMLSASNAGYLHRFGHAVAVSGDTIAVAAPFTGQHGSVYIFERHAGGTNNWGQTRIITSTESTTQDSFGTAIALSGDTLAVMAQKSYGNSNAVYVYGRNQGGLATWGLIKRLSTPAVPGGGVALDGDRLVVGLPGEDGRRGAAYIYERNAGGSNNWGQVKRLVALDRAEGDDFGAAVAISGEQVLVGAPGDEGGRGGAYLFQRALGGADNWGQADKLTAPEGVALDAFGQAVALSSTAGTVGAPRADVQTKNSGTAYVFRWVPIAAQADAALTLVNTPVTVNLLANDVLPRGQPLTTTLATVPSHGAVSLTGGSLVYTPTAAFTGSDTFTYTVSTGFESLSAPVTIWSVTQIYTTYLPIILRGR